MTWQQFEQLVSEAFRLKGHTVAETGGGGADGGVDLVLSKGGEKFLVQCKQWRAFKVGVDVVRELYGVMAARGAAGGFVVTSGRFTDEATAFAAGRNVTLIDGPRLHAMIQQAQAARQATRPSALSSARSAPSSPPACPKCSKPMVVRTARRGANMAWVFDRYVTERSLYEIQTEAQQSRRGLWTDAEPVAPWSWRAAHKVAR